MSTETIDTHLRPTRPPDIDAAVRPLTRGMVLPEALQMRGSYRRRQLRVATLVVYGRRDHPWTEQVLQLICPDPGRYADRVELAYVDDAAHFSADDAPAAVAELSLDWFERAG